MAALILKRVGLGFLTLLLVSVLIFAGTQILPGDVASAILGQNATPEALAALRDNLGLNQPLLTRYLSWLAGFATGNLGTSLANQQPVADLLWPRFWNTMALAAFAFTGLAQAGRKRLNARRGAEIPGQDRQRRLNGRVGATGASTLARSSRRLQNFIPGAA